jgi:hypothetical protein
MLLALGIILSVVPAQRRDECVREDVLLERCKSVLELVAAP